MSSLNNWRAGLAFVFVLAAGGAGESDSRPEPDFDKKYLELYNRAVETGNGHGMRFSLEQII